MQGYRGKNNTDLNHLQLPGDKMRAKYQFIL
jgi:hypothetical protein